MSLLKFKGHIDHRVPKPNTYALGMRPQYLGFSYDDNGALVPAEFTIDDTTAEGQGLLAAIRRDGCFVPVDEAAANAVGQPLPSQPSKKAVAANG